jgi:hypothetical protein
VADYVTVYDQPRRLVVPGVMNAVARSFANVDATLTGGEVGWSLPILFGRVFVSGDVSYVRGDQDGDASRGIAPGPLAEMPPARGRLSARYDDGRFSGSVEGVFAADQERVDPSLNEARTPGWGVMNVAAGFRQGRLRWPRASPTCSTASTSTTSRTSATPSARGRACRSPAGASSRTPPSASERGQVSNRGSAGAPPGRGT